MKLALDGVKLVNKITDENVHGFQQEALKKDFKRNVHHGDY